MTEKNSLLGLLNLPVQLAPFPINPLLHLHWKLPMVLVQVALEWQFPVFFAHSSTSVFEITHASGGIYDGGA